MVDMLHKKVVLLFFIIVLYSVSCSPTEKSTPYLSLKPDMTVPFTIKKIPVTDCRAVRGFLGTPVDGSVKSWGYRGAIVEYPDTGAEGYDAGAGVDYSYNDNDGIHIRLWNNEKFDTVVLRGGAHTRIYRDVTSLTEPGDTIPLYEFGGESNMETVHFSNSVAADKLSFFGTDRGGLCDIGFYRMETGRASEKNWQAWAPAAETITLTDTDAEFAPESIYRAMDERYDEPDWSVVSLVRKEGPGRPVTFEKNRSLHFLTPPFEEKTGIEALMLDMNVSCDSGAFRCTTTVQDPLNPRLDLICFEFSGEGSGRYRVNLDFPDQVLFRDSQVWLTLSFDEDVTMSGPDGGAPEFLLSFVPEETAFTEAFEHRKFLLRSYFIILSEARQWGHYQKQSEEPYKRMRYAKQYAELFMTIDQCHELNPTDDTVRQYREWVYLRHLEKLSEISPPPGPPEGVPSWAWYPRLAWLETRKIAEWWLDNRLVPTGEFGGMVGDDTDFYQQVADLPYFETDGIAARLMDGAARLDVLANKETLREGVNILVTDALHAYEEGINHLALMPKWFYGDPLYNEQCMESAKNIKKYTILLEDGRRHFRHSRDFGYRDIVEPREPTVEGRSVPLLLHTLLQAADYNRNPEAVMTLREWADTWLRFQKPGQYASSVDVLTGKVGRHDKKWPLFDRGQHMTYIWLYSLTGDIRYVELLLKYFRDTGTPGASLTYLGDLFNLALLDKLEPRIIDTLTDVSPELALYRTTDPGSVIEQIIGTPETTNIAIANLYDTIRWPDMYTSAEQYTDRLFFQNLLKYASVCYLGGYTGRNKINPAHAVSWEGFGTDYSALVLENRCDRLKAVVYSYADRSMNGLMKVWALEHGNYHIKTGIDTDGDFSADKPSGSSERELMKADALDLELSPKVVTVIEIEQVEKLDSIFTRADLAVAARETELDGSNISGVVHNIGSGDVGEFDAAIIDAQGRVVTSKSFGELKAPLDLIERRLPFTIELPRNAGKGWKLAIDPDNTVAEIYEGNNSVALDELPAVDYWKGWE